MCASAGIRIKLACTDQVFERSDALLLRATGVDFVRQRMLGTQPAAQQFASGMQKMPHSVAAHLQSMAGTRLAALLGKLTEDTDAKDEAHLQALLGLCTTALRCNAALLSYVHGNDGQVAFSWNERGAVSGVWSCDAGKPADVHARICVVLGCI